MQALAVGPYTGQDLVMSLYTRQDLAMDLNTGQDISVRQCTEGITSEDVAIV